MMNNLVAGCIGEIPRRSADRTLAFLKQCHKLGVTKDELFDTLDLIHKKNMVKVIYCLHALAEICHTRRLVPFFTGGKKERLQQREEWKRKARDSLRKGFEGWKNSALLQQIKNEQVAEESITLPPAEIEEASGDVGAGTGLAFRSPTPRRISETETIAVSARRTPVEYSPVEPQLRFQSLQQSRYQPRQIPEEPTEELIDVGTPFIPEEEHEETAVARRWQGPRFIDRVHQYTQSVGSWKADQALIKLLLFWGLCMFVWGYAFFQSNLRLYDM